MNPAIYQHWKRQQMELKRRERLIAARRAPLAPPPFIASVESESAPAPAPKRRRPE